MSPDRGQSEVIGTLAVLSITVGLIVLVGTGVISTIESTSEPILDAEVTGHGTSVEIGHVGGDGFNTTALSVTLEGGGNTTRFGVENASITGDGDGVFEAGEELWHAHDLGGDVIYVLVVHEPSGVGLVDTRVDVGGSGGTGGARGGPNAAPNVDATFSPSPAGKGRPIGFDASDSSDADGMITLYEWDWTGDGTWDATGATPEHTYSSTGTYTVRVRATDDNGATDTTTLSVTVQEPPTAAFSYTVSGEEDVDVDVPILFDASASSDPDGTISTYEWDWTADGTYDDTGETATHLYTSTGTYDVTLRVTDDDGVTDTVTKSVTVGTGDEDNQAPTASFSASGDDWYSDAWRYRKEIEFDHGRVAADLSDFPVLVDVTDSDLKHDAQGDADDVVFTAGDGTTKLPHEIESYDASSGHLLAWVKLPTLNGSAPNTTVYLYYGDSDAANQENATGVWDSNYAMVQHFEESSGDATDSTGNDNDGTVNGATQGASGVVGTAYDFENSETDDVTVPDDASLDLASEVTVSAWIRPESIDDWNRIVAKSHDENGWPYTHYGLLFDSDDHLRLELADCTTEDSWCQEDETGATTVDTGEWTFATVTYDGSDLRVYYDGREDGSRSESFSIVTNDMPLTIGKSGFDGDYYDGRIDEVRVSSTARSADWIETQYDTTNDPSSLYAVGAEERAYPVAVDASASSDPDGSITTYEWDWTDDGTYDDTGVTASHSYPGTGKYTIELRVTDDDDTTANTTEQIDVSAGNAVPVAAFSASPESPDTGETVTFDGADSSDPDGAIATYEWDWTDDGSYDATGQEATHAYESAGNYTVALRVTDDGGETNTFRKTVTVSGTTFVEETATADLGSSPGGGAIVFADFDGDGYLDVFMNDDEYNSDSVRLRENRGDLTFKNRDDTVSVNGGRGAGTGDYDDDGDPDLIVGVSQTLNENKGNFVFEDATAGAPNNEEALMFVDVDGDGDLDVWSPGEDSLWHENTDGGWTSHTSMPGQTGDRTANGEGATAADIDDDGYVDFLFAQGDSDVDAWLNDGDDTYSYEPDVDGAFGLPEDVGNHENMEWAWGDYDNDGDMDVYVSGHDNEGLYRNDGDGSFTDVTSSAGISESDPDGAAWGDYDNDGDLDLILADADGNSDLYSNDGDGTFTEVDATANLDGDGALGSTVGWFDADNDGDLDLITNDPATLWNNTRDDGEYLRVIARGNTSPTTPIGAQVEVYENGSGTLVGHRELIASQNQLQPPLRQHFGVDPSESYDVKVRFPSGAVAWRNGTVPEEENVTVGGNTLENTVRIHEPDVVTFVEETATANLGSSPGGGAIVFADFDEDGYLDVFMNDDEYGSNVVRLRGNDGDMTFTEYDSTVSVDGGRGAGTGDYDNDGDPDLIVGVGQRLNENTGGFSFSGSTVGGWNNNNEEALMFVDVDGDGDLDVWSPGEDYMWHEQTSSGWTSHTTLPGTTDDETANGEGATAADIDDDGYVDLLFAQGDSDVDAWLNDGDYTYTETDVGDDLNLPEDVGNHEDMEWAWGDYDNDGDMDVYVSGNDNEGLYENDGTGTFTEVSSSAGVTASDPDGAAWGDYDNDGDLDLVVVEHQGVSNLYRNEGDGTFVPRESPAGIGSSGDIGSPTGWFDADNDGDLDLVSNEPVRLWNNTLDDGRYLRVMVEGNGTSEGSPETPIGAQVEVYDSSGTLVGHRELIASQNQLQPPLRGHFGVDPSEAYDVKVRFPSGAVVWENDTIPDRQFVAVGSTTLHNTIRIEEPAPGWPTKQYDAANLGVTGGRAPRTDLETKWTYSAPTDGFDASGPVVSADTIYIGDKDEDSPTLHAIWTNGTRRWTYAGASDEFKSTAAIDDQRVYAAAKDGVLHAVDFDDGTASWTFSTAGEIDKGSVTVDDGVVYVGDKGGTIYAIYADTGVEMWSVDVGEEVKSAPAVANETVYVAAKKSGKLYALDAIDGAQQWTFSTGEEIELSAPTVAGGTVYVGEKTEGWFYAIHAANGTERWSVDLGEEVKSSPAVTDGTVYIAEKKSGGDEKGVLYALDASDGSEEWSYTANDEFEDAAPAVVDGSVYVGDKGGYVYVLDAVTGSERWTGQVGSEIKAPLAVTENAIYVADNKDDAVYALHDPPVFADDFDRADSNALDAGWSETESESDDARIRDGRLDFEPDNDGERPAIEHTFDEQTSGTVRLTFTFNFERTGSESWYGASIQLGDGDSMVDPDTAHDRGVAVNLKWGGDEGAGVSEMTDEEGFGYTLDGADTQIGVVSGDAGSNAGGDATVSVTVDLDANTYDVTVTGPGLVSGSGTATDVPFENDVGVDTLRIFLDEVAGGNFGDLEVDDVEIEREE